MVVENQAAQPSMASSLAAAVVKTTEPSVASWAQRVPCSSRPEGVRRSALVILLVRLHGVAEDNHTRALSGVTMVMADAACCDETQKYPQ